MQNPLCGVVFVKTLSLGLSTDGENEAVMSMLAAPAVKWQSSNNIEAIVDFLNIMFLNYLYT